MSELKNITCPSCGAPLEYNPNIETEVKCSFCGSYVSKDDDSLKNLKVGKEIIDLSKADIDQLHKIEKLVKDTTSFKIKWNAHALLVKELGDKYEEFIKNKQVDIKGNDDNIYRVYMNGMIQVFDKDDNTRMLKEGQLYRNKYPAQDCLVTLIKYIKMNCDGLNNLWGCGNISVMGGELVGGDR